MLPIPGCMVMMQVGARFIMMMGCPRRAHLLGEVLGRMTKFVVVVTYMTFLATNKRVFIIGYHVHYGSDEVAVTCCAVYSFYTSLITSDKVWGSFSYTFSAKLCASLRPLMKMQMAVISLLKSHLLVSVLK